MADGLEWLVNATEILEDTNSSRYVPKRKRGKRAGIRVRTRLRGHRPPLPTIVFGNVRSIRNKTDELTAHCKFNSEYRDTSLICLTETWLEHRDADGTVNVDNFSLVRNDRDLTSKHRGGGVAIYINERWCKNFTIKDKHCDDNLEYLTISCRPFYLPREFNCVYVTVAYIPPGGDKQAAAELLSNCVSNIDDKYPEGAKLLLGDFNDCDIQDLIPNYNEFVNCTTRDNKTLDLLFCNVKDAYQVRKRPPLGNSDHNMLYCMPSYRQKLKTQKCRNVQIKQWSHDNVESLRGCFDCTDWDVLYDDCADLDSNVDVCISFCVDNIVPTKTVKIYPNNKPWVTKDVKSLLNRKKAALSNNNNDIRSVQRELNKSINDAKRAYKDKVEHLFKSNKTKDAWKGLKCLSGFVSKKVIPEPDDINTYVNDLNVFYARFDDKNVHAECNEMFNVVNSKNDQKIFITREDVSLALSSAKPGKACGPDKICGKVVKGCKEQLVTPMLRLFQFSLDNCIVPSCGKPLKLLPYQKRKFLCQKMT